jgi:hypothetical protein
MDPGPAIVRHVREQAPDTLITVDTHWSALQTEAGAAPLVLLGARWPRLLEVFTAELIIGPADLGLVHLAGDVG